MRPPGRRGGGGRRPKIRRGGGRGSGKSKGCLVLALVGSGLMLASGTAGLILAAVIR